MNNANEHFEVLSEHTLVGQENAIAKNFAEILANLGIDAWNDPNTKHTAQRYAKMLCREVCKGRFTAAPSLTTFPNPAKDTDMQMTGPIAVRSLCSHHFCPIIGQCWIAYLPGKRVVGLSKFDRVVEWFAARPQIQEGLTAQITDYLEEHLQPKGLAVVLRAQHTCMSWRGVKAHPEAGMGTNVMRGTFRKDAAARAEFLHFVGR